MRASDLARELLTGTPFHASSIGRWLAIELVLEIQELEKRVKELEVERDGWKNLAEALDRARDRAFSSLVGGMRKSDG